MQPVAPSASGSTARQVSPDTLPKKCPTCIVCEEPLFDRRPVVVTDCPHRFHSHCTSTRRVDWQLADCRCTVCGTKATDVIEWFDKRYGSADLRCKLALLEACRHGYYSTVVKALNADPSLAKGLIGSGVYETGQALIHEAAAHGQVSIVDFLLGRGAAINLKNGIGDSPLLIAVSRGFVEVADLLLSRGAIGLHKAFSMAATQCDIHMLRELISHGAKVNCVLFYFLSDDFGIVPFHAIECCLAHSQDKVSNETLLELVNFLISQGSRVSTETLTLAGQKGRLEVVKYLIARGADVNGIVGKPLYAAVWHNQIEIVRELLCCGALVNKTFKAGKTVMHCASEKGYLEIVNLLIDANASVDPFVTVDGVNTHSPLCAAIGAGHEAVVRMLIERGAGLDIADHDGNTPLAAAIRSKNSVLFSLLLDSGADVNASGGLAIKTAIELRSCSVFVGLIKKGADVFGALDTGETPLEFAKRLNYKDEVRILYAVANAALLARAFAVFDPEMTAVEMSEVMDVDCLINRFHGIDLIYDRQDDSDESDT